MDSRQRVSETLEFGIPDRVPIDFGGTPTTGISASMVYKIKQHYDLLKANERINRTISNVGRDWQ